jgi:two-component system cell cycle response regulator
MGRLAAGMWAGGAAIGFLLAMLPQPQHGSRTLLLAVSAASIVIALLLRFGARRLPGWALPVSAGMATLFGSLLTFVGGGAGEWVDVQVIYLFVALGSAYYFSDRQLGLQLALVATSYGVVLALTDPLEAGAPRWLATVAAVLTAAGLVRALRLRVTEIVDRLADAARTDPLTGLQNRRGFEESFGAEVERAKREGRSLTVLLGDLDHFKSLNDRMGHPAGDAALVRVGQLLLAALRRPDPVARTGGEEFALILPGAAGEEAWAIAERLRASVEETFSNQAVELTISLGLAQFPQNGDTADTLLDAADQALYAAKRLGRNRSVIFSEEIAPLVRERAASADVQLATLLGLAEALDLRDSGTADHCRTVGHYCAVIAEQMGLPPEQVKRIETAGILHDVGKIGLPDEILQKPGTLTEDEWRPLRRHPEIGARILNDDAFADIRDWIVAHHERLDGTGYPHGLSGEEIPLEARIIAVADAYEAMTSHRVYRPAASAETARSELLACAGSQFDPMVAAAFIAALREQDHHPVRVPVAQQQVAVVRQTA